MSKTITVQNGDFYVNEAGSFEWTTTPRHKLAQDIANTLLQEFNPTNNTGSELSTIIGSSFFAGSPEQNKSYISQIINDTMRRFKSLQNFLEDLPSEEKISNWTVLVEKASYPSLSYYYYLKVVTEAGVDPLEISYEVELGQTRDPNLVE